jgi:hypothetical protein
VFSSGEDMMLDDLFGNRVRGGARPTESKEFCLATFSGELVCEKLWTGDRCGWSESCVVDLETGSSVPFSSIEDGVDASNGGGDCALGAPK